jgi:hypothetical protein
VNSFAAFAAISGDAIGKAIEDTLESISWMPSTVLVSTAVAITRLSSWGRKPACSESPEYLSPAG